MRTLARSLANLASKRPQVASDPPARVNCSRNSRAVVSVVVSRALALPLSPSLREYQGRGKSAIRELLTLEEAFS